MTDETTSTTAQTLTLPEKFMALDENLNQRLVERTKEIRTSVVALASGTHHFCLGSPGIAKSLMVRTITNSIDFSGYDIADFEVLMTKFSTPEEVFGPISIKALEDDRYRRQTDGYLPTALIAFIDEIFKANSSILNSLLWIINERKFRNDGVITDAPLISLFCASNELPQGEELEALYDRIHFRHVIRPIQEPGNFIQMLASQTLGPVEKVLTIAEVQEAREQVKQVIIPDDVTEAMSTLRQSLKVQGVEPTDRRFAECLKIIRATAWLDGRGQADIDDMKLLLHVLWTVQDEKPIVDKAVMELANPLDKDAMDLLEEVEKLASELDEVMRDSDNKQVRNKKGIELHSKLERAKSDLDALTKRADKANRKSEVIGDVETRLLSVTRTLLKEIFKIDAPSA